MNQCPQDPTARKDGLKREGKRWEDAKQFSMFSSMSTASSSPPRLFWEVCRWVTGLEMGLMGAGATSSLEPFTHHLAYSHKDLFMWST